MSWEPSIVYFINNYGMSRACTSWFYWLLKRQEGQRGGKAREERKRKRERGWEGESCHTVHQKGRRGWRRSNNSADNTRVSSEDLDMRNRRTTSRYFRPSSSYNRRSYSLSLLLDIFSLSLSVSVSFGLYLFLSDHLLNLRSVFSLTLMQHVWGGWPRIVRTIVHV